MTEAKVEQTEQLDKTEVWLKIATRTAWLLAISLVCAFIYYQITREDVLPVTEIAINGQFEHIAIDELQVLIEDGVEGNFFTLSVAKLYGKLLAMPWAEQVWIHRVWPDKIKINILEQKPVAIWSGNGLINAKGKLFTDDVSGFKGHLPEFVVDERYKQEIIRWNTQYQKTLNDFDLKIKKFELDERKNQSLYLSNNIKLDLGSEETAQRLTRFLKVFKSNLYREEQRISRIDLRYSNGFSVAWK